MLALSGYPTTFNHGLLSMENAHNLIGIMTPQTHLMARLGLRYGPALNKGKAVSEALLIED